MQTARVRGRRVDLPDELAEFFEGASQVEVTDYPTHLSLWKKGRGGLSGSSKVVGRGQFLAAAREYRKQVETMRDSPARFGLYLAGYVIECRLKASICERYAVNTTDDAEERIARDLGRRYRLTGADGHNLELLWRLAGCQAEVGPGMLQQQWLLVANWDVSWRYEPPRNVQLIGFLGAVEVVYNHLESRS